MYLLFNKINKQGAILPNNLILCKLFLQKTCQKRDCVIASAKFFLIFRENLMRLLNLFLFLGLLIGQAQAAGVAVIAPKDGDEARFGLQLKEGVKIAVDEINAAGGLLGEKIELITIDDTCSESFFHGDTQRLYTGEGSNVNLVVGPYCDSKPLPYKTRNALQILTQPLSESDFNDPTSGVLKIGGMIKQQAEVVAKVYKEQWVDKNIAVIYDSRYTATYETAAYLQEILTADNLQNRLNLYDFAAYKKLKPMAKEIVKSNKIAYILGNKNQIAKMAQKLQEKDENILLILDEYQAGRHFFKEMGNFAEGTYWLRLDDQKSNAEFADKLIDFRIMGHEPQGLGVMGYSSVMLWFDMAKTAKSFDVKALDKLSSQKEWKMPWGKVKFNKGQISKFSGWNMYRFNDGEYTQVN